MLLGLPKWSPEGCWAPCFPGDSPGMRAASLHVGHGDDPAKQPSLLGGVWKAASAAGPRRKENTDVTAASSWEKRSAARSDSGRLSSVFLRKNSISLRAFPSGSAQPAAAGAPAGSREPWNRSGLIQACGRQAQQEHRSCFPFQRDEAQLLVFPRRGVQGDNAGMGPCLACSMGVTGMHSWGKRETWKGLIDQPAACLLSSGNVKHCSHLNSS